MLEGLSPLTSVIAALYLANSIVALKLGKQVSFYKIYAGVWFVCGTVGFVFVGAMLVNQFNLSVLFWLYVTSGLAFSIVSFLLTRALWVASAYNKLQQHQSRKPLRYASGGPSTR